MSTPKTKGREPINFQSLFNYFDTGAEAYLSGTRSMEPTLVEKPNNYAVANAPPTKLPTTSESTVEPTIQNTMPSESEKISYSWKDPRFREILLDRQLFNESGFDPDVINGTRVSSAGAQGIAQFMPSTWAEMINKGYVPEGAKPTDVDYAIEANYRYMTDIYNSPIVQEAQDEEERIKRTLAGYNAGPGFLVRRITEAKKRGVPWISLFKPETQKYVENIPKDVKLHMEKGNYKSQFDRSKYNK